METLVLALRLLMAGVFAVAGVAKLRDREGSRRALEDFGVPERFTRAGGVLLPVAEIAIAIALLVPPSARWGAIAAGVLLAAFMLAIGNAMRHGRAPDCHCFGQLHSEPAGRSTLVRNAVLIGAAIVVAVSGPGPGIHTWVAERSVLELALLGGLLAATPLALKEYAKLQRRRRRRRTKERMLAELEVAYSPSGRAVGSPAPDFSLPDIRGGSQSLETLCARGRPVVLVFVHPGCGPCRKLVPRLAEWDSRLSEIVTITVLSEGPSEENAPLLNGHDVHLLLQDGGDVYRAYDLRQGTPSAVVVTPERTIGSVSVAGEQAVEELIRVTLRRAQPTEALAPTT